MQTRSDENTDHIVFYIFHSLNILLVTSSIVCAYVLKQESQFDQVMAQVFIWGALFALIGSKAGGYLGAVMEEDACSQMDMGVLSAMGSFIGATAFGLSGTVLAGFYFFFPAIHISWVLGALYLGLFVFCSRNNASVYRVNKISCCGIRVNDEGEPLPVQPMKMKNKLAIMLALSVIIEILLTILMIIVMKRDLANGIMLGGMAYGMSGAMLGGLIGGWLAGLLDKHAGEPEHDNPIMVCGMALMGGMMGAMPAAMVGGMNAFMGPVTIIPTVVGGIAILVVCYFWMYRREFRLVWAKRHLPFTLGGIRWQRQSSFQSKA
ncbi:MAG: hypothetical protein HY537_16900 [Deltaproteobacteria bacterium]|nr:hypothetical protein [Deltaproteobacteria bacterium]